jgi:hypothetical protein
MSNLNLTQTDLNESLRGLTDVDIMMFLPDKNISFPSNAVTMNTKALSYTSNLQSLLEFSSLPQANIATFENNSWILDGSFMSPSLVYGGGGDSYTGYISEELTDDNGDYTTNPILSVTLSAKAENIEYLSIRFAGGIDTSYPKVFKIRTYDEELIKEHTFDMTKQSGLPLLVAKIGDQNVSRVEFEFVGTVCPHRRSRLNKIMFGKAEQVENYFLQSWKIDDKASLVADSIPTKTLSYSVINYDGDYDIDNPGNKIPENYNEVLVLFTFAMEYNGLWKYAPTKTFNLVDISTTPDGIVTFQCGSLLDTLTDTYDQEIYTGPKTIGTIMNSLLSFSGIGVDQCELNEFTDYKINIPLPEAPVREIIQRLAFSCGATLTVNDDNKIVFSKKNIIPTADTTKFMFNQPTPFNSAAVLLEEPNAEALVNTTNIGMYTYDTAYSEEITDLGTVDISVIEPVRITFSAAVGGIAFDMQSLQDQYADITVIEAASQHAVVKVTWTEAATLPIQVKVLGIKAETTKTMPKTASMDTLLLDSGLALTTPVNLTDKNKTRDKTTFYYTDWYGAKFKYICKTRNEYLVNAGDIIYFETPFSNGKPSRVGYVLRNSYSDNEDSGEMEVITIGNG